MLLVIGYLRFFSFSCYAGVSVGLSDQQYKVVKLNVYLPLYSTNRLNPSFFVLIRPLSSMYVGKLHLILDENQAYLD